MSLNYFAYIYMSPGFSPENNTVVSENNHAKFKAVGINMGEQVLAIDVAKKLVSEGVQMIEVCGGFGPNWIAKISEAIHHAVPIGGVYYGPEARKPLLEILSK